MNAHPCPPRAALTKMCARVQAPLDRARAANTPLSACCFPVYMCRLSHTHAAWACMRHARIASICAAPLCLCKPWTHCAMQATGAGCMQCGAQGLLCSPGSRAALAGTRLSSSSSKRTWRLKRQGPWARRVSCRWVGGPSVICARLSNGVGWSEGVMVPDCSSRVAGGLALLPRPAKAMVASNRLYVRSCCWRASGSSGWAVRGRAVVGSSP